MPYGRNLYTGNGPRPYRRHESRPQMNTTHGAQYGAYGTNTIMQNGLAYPYVQSYGTIPNTLTYQPYPAPCQQQGTYFRGPEYAVQGYANAYAGHDQTITNLQPHLTNQGFPAYTSTWSSPNYANHGGHTFFCKLCNSEGHREQECPVTYQLRASANLNGGLPIPQNYYCSSARHGAHRSQARTSMQHFQRSTFRHPYQPHSSRPQPLPTKALGIKQEINQKWECEPCGKVFTLHSQHQAHIAQHVQCWSKDCDFIGSKKIVSSHYHTVHGQYQGDGIKEIECEGQKFRILLGNSPDELNMWLTARKKNWPSAKNVEAKLKKLEERRRAGDVLEDTEDVKTSVKCTAFARAGRCRYGQTCKYLHQRGEPCIQYQKTGKCFRRDRCKFTHTTATFTGKRPRSGDDPTGQQPKISKTSGLLRKLMENEIQREQRYLLQAFKYIEENNFFAEKLTKPLLAS